jgi:FtsZ-binding cell division protein ZapB
MNKGKIAIISVLAAAALATPVIVQQRTINELRQENEGLKQQAAQVAPLQEQLARAAQDAADAGGGAETQMHEMARLRAEVSKLREQSKELSKAQQQIQTLHQRLASEAEASRNQMAALQADAQTTRQIAQSTRNSNACINNLRLFDAAKQQWALENRKLSTDTPTPDDLRPYLGRGTNGEMPVCPDGGVYTIGAVSEKPTCNISGHVLP